MKKTTLTALALFSAACVQAQTPTLIKDFWSGNSGGCPGTKGVIYNGNYYFAPTADLVSNELWKTDGTTTGTAMIKDINTGGNGADAPDIVYNNAMYFTGNDGSAIWTDLYRSDGTSGGTYLLKDVNPSSYQGVNLSSFIIYKNLLFFVADGGGSLGRELWRTDGTANGTYVLKDIVPGAGSSSPYQLFIWNNTLYFIADTPGEGSEIWKTDGTSGGTVMVKDIDPGTNGGINTSYFSPVVFGSYFYFFADNGVNGEELWRSDGTTGGTTMVKDINAGSSGSVVFSSGGPCLLVFKNKLYFLADNGTNGREFWTSDGTSGGTVLLKDIRPGSSGSCDLYSFIVNAQDMKMYLRVTEGVNGYELWVSDGTSGGTTMIKDIYAGSSSGIGGSTNLVTLFGNIYFVANDNISGREYWKSDGTLGGTTILKDAYPGSMDGNCGQMTVINGIGWYFADNGVNGQELWKTDFTTSGTQQVYDINPGAGSSAPSGFVLLGSKILFSAYHSSYGSEMWVMNAITGVEEIEAPKLEVFPNPCNGLVNVNYGGGEAQMEVLNLLGETLLSRMITTGNNIVDLSELANGVYFVKVTANGKSSVQKLVRE